MNSTPEIVWLYIPDSMPYGVNRRKFILDWFERNPQGHYSINCKYRPQMWHDPDLRKLVKSGKLKIVRSGTARCRRTYLVKA